MKKHWIIIFGALLLIIAGCQEENSKPVESNNEVKETQKKEKETASLSESNFYKPTSRKQINHVHGIGYPGNQHELFVATHLGPLIYLDGTWYEAKANNHDYMGFQAASDGFYSSGHPGEASDLPNPLGLIKSTDRGKTLEQLGFQGESDFHYLAVGYETHSIYAVNQQKNSEMDIGVYYSEDASDWNQVNLKGTPDQINGIFAHPSDANVVAITSPNGLYLSEDQGESFTPMTKGSSITSMVFLKDRIIFAKQGAASQLVSLKNREETPISMPNKIEKAIDYLAVNPQNENEISFHTSDGSLYQTKDGGESWVTLIDQGKIN
ncbi:F510_1955 family glycosylhydrolase [Pseudalkalibacillus hwajinpoensis]|uniref:F510_1955 family glycosylhydrolase n=1 Tax=Guptibacillus hwajinpoensis TaxID=208199 RepID=UPI001CD42DDA|nr:hypothetical protein [Pseudalkalibacillus hwajinpoensis]MCA0990585.1 hypothetical protein [Pseudalkalibacillus hwajinpoensis]